MNRLVILYPEHRFFYRLSIEENNVLQSFISENINEIDRQDFHVIANICLSCMRSYFLERKWFNLKLFSELLEHICNALDNKAIRLIVEEIP